MKETLDILHLYLSEVVAAFAAPARRTLYGLTIGEKWRRAGEAFLKTIKNTIYFFTHQKDYQKQLADKNWIYLVGTNNYHSLEFLKDEIEDTVYVTPFKFQKPGETIVPLHLPMHFFYFIKNLPELIRLIFSKKYPVLRAWDAAVRACGQYDASLLLLKKLRPKSITFSNDHTIEPRALLLAAKTLNLPTFYIQHACVRPDFPPLKFSVSFLEGQDALDKYRESGVVDGAVELIGVPRIAPYLDKKNTNTTVKKIGICSNLLDSIDAIQATIHVLAEHFPTLQFTYRPHPADKRPLDLPPNIRLSKSNEENAFEFLTRQDLIIAGNTSIHYEAAILNVVPVYYKFDKGGKTDDMYGFVRKGLVEEAGGVEELVGVIKKEEVSKNNVIFKSKYYHALLGTTHEQESQRIVIRKIKSFLDQ